MKRIFALFLACVVAAGTMPVVGCNSQQTLNEVKSLAPVITDVLIAACDFAPPPAPALCATGAATLATLETHAFTLWQAYLTAEKAGTATPSMWAELNLAFQVMVNQASDVFALAHIVNAAHQAEILQMVDAAEALLAVVEGFMPAPPVRSMAAMRTMRLAAKLPVPNPKTGKYDQAFMKAWQKKWNKLPAVQVRHMQLGGSSQWFSNLCLPIGGADC